MSSHRCGSEFAPGARVKRYQESDLRDAGFEPGYPLFSRPSESELEELLLLMHTLTIPELDALKDKPTIQLAVLVPDGSGYGKIRPLTIDVSHIGRSWQAGSASWYVKGAVWLDQEQLWRIDRKTVSHCRIHALLSRHTAFMQLVPIGRLGRPILAPATDDFRWGDLSSRTLPPR